MDCIKERWLITQREMTKPASNVVLGTNHVLLMKTPSREGKCPVGTQSAMEGGALASMGKKCPNTLERSCSSYPFKPETWRERVGGMKSPNTSTSLTFFQIWWEQTQKTIRVTRGWYAHQAHQPPHLLHPDYTSMCFSWGHFPKILFPKWGHSQHRLWRICFSNQSTKANEIFQVDF